MWCLCIINGKKHFLARCHKLDTKKDVAEPTFVRFCHFTPSETVKTCCTDNCEGEVRATLEIFRFAGVANIGLYDCSPLRSNGTFLGHFCLHFRCLFSHNCKVAFRGYLRNSLIKLPLTVTLSSGRFAQTNLR